MSVGRRARPHQRPKNIDARTEAGHWEGDLIIYKRTRPVLVLHERKSRVTLAARLAGKTAAETISVMLAIFARIKPAHWQRVLEYAHAGGLQAVLDEYAHLLKESLGVAAAPVAEMAEKIAAELIAALKLITASLRVDEVTAPPYAREVKLNSEPMHIRFAMRFGDDRHDEEPLPARLLHGMRNRRSLNNKQSHLNVGLSFLI
jgi:hypothetical protein